MAAKLTSQRRIEEVLYFPIQLSDQINESVKEAKIFKPECSYVAKKVDRIRQMLYSVYRHATSAAPFYSHPLRRIASDVSKNLEESLTLVRKCRRDSFIVRLVATVSEADFRKSFSLLDSSAADLKWVISVFKFGVVAGGIVLSLPPIAVHNPMISWVWSFITSLHIGRLQDKIDAATVLASLAEDNDRNKRIIVEEGGVPPLLKLLNDSSSIEGQIAAASALDNLANDIEGVRAIIDQSGVPTIVQVLDDSPTEVQTTVVNLVATMAEHCPLEQEDLARGNAMMCLLPTIISQGKMTTTKNQLIASCVNGTADRPYRYDECRMQSTAKIAQPLPSLQNEEVYGEVMHEVRIRSTMSQHFVRIFSIVEIKRRVEWFRNRFRPFKISVSIDSVYFNRTTKKVTPVLSKELGA